MRGDGNSLQCARGGNLHLRAREEQRMGRDCVVRFVVALLLCMAARGAAQNAKPAGGETEKSYPGFDRNDYPSDAALPALRKTFRYTGYWLNNPQGESRNSWVGKRAMLRQFGFGF